MQPISPWHPTLQDRVGTQLPPAGVDTLAGASTLVAVLPRDAGTKSSRQRGSNRYVDESLWIQGLAVEQRRAARRGASVPGT